MGNRLVTASGTQVKAGQQEMMKWYWVLDASERPIEIYEVKANAKHGDDCLVTYLEYVGDSTTATKGREAFGVWDSAYDMA